MNIINDTLKYVFELAEFQRWSKYEVAKFLSCWLCETTPELLVKWLCLNDGIRTDAEQSLLNFVRDNELVIAARRIERKNSMSRNTDWGKTLEKANGSMTPLVYYNRVRVPKPDRFLYGALHWLVLRWRGDLKLFVDHKSLDSASLKQLNQRLDDLYELDKIPVFHQSQPIPLTTRHLLKLYERGGDGKKLAEKLLKLQMLRDRQFTAEDRKTLEAVLEEKLENECNSSEDTSADHKNFIEAKNINNLFELLVLLKSAFLLHGEKKDPAWRIASADVEFGQKNSPPKPTIILKNDELDLECRISKGGIEKLDALSKKYRKATGSGFEPDVVYVFVKTSTNEAVVFLGDAKNYSTTDHDVAVRDKLLNVFAFSKALGIKLHGCGESGELIEHHKINGDPVPSFMLFFQDMKKGEREFRSVMERFSIRCFDCSGKPSEQRPYCTEECPGGVKKSFLNIIRMISDKDFKWPLQFNIKTGGLRVKPHGEVNYTCE